MKKLFTFSLLLVLCLKFASAQQHEPADNTFAGADTLTLWVTDTATIQPSGDVDYFIIHMNHCGSLIFNLVNIPGLNLEMTAYSSPNTDSMIGYSSYSGNRVLPLIVPAGDIYVKVDDHFGNTSAIYYSITASVDTVDIYECDNDFATAYPLPDSTSLQATINGVNGLWNPSHPTDIDFYKIHMTQCGNLVLSLTNIPGLNLEMYAYSAPNTDSLIGYSSYGGNRILELTPASGDIYVQVDDHFGNTSTIPYGLTVFVDTGDAYECNNSFATAYTLPDHITLNAKIRGSNLLWDPVTDIDIYKVHMDRCGTLVMNLTNIPGMNLEMYAYNSPAADSMVAYSSYGGNRTLEVAGSAGDMYIQVDDHFNATSASPYSLSINLDTVDFYECNNNFATATPVSDSETIVAKIQGIYEGVTDVDYYKVHMSRCGTLLLNLTNIPGLNLEMTAYNSPNSDSVIAYSSYGGDRSMQISGSEGDVYIKVDDHFGNTSDNTYTLQIYIDTVDFYECNNNFATASVVGDSETIVAKIEGIYDGVTDVDFYKVHMSRCGTLLLNLTNIPGLNLEMYAYSDPNADSLIAYSSYGGNRALQIAEPGGDVYIKVDDHFGNTSNSTYTLQVYIDTADIYECNNLFSDASSIPDNITLTAQILGTNLLLNQTSDVDYYKLTVDRCGVLELNLTNIPGLNLEMSVYSSPNADSLLGYSSYGGNRSMQVLVSPGDIYIKVDDHFGNTSFTPYTLAVVFDTTGCGCNYSFATACQIPDNITFNGEMLGTNALMSPSVDINYYKVTVDRCGVLVLNLTNIPGLNLEMYAYQAPNVNAQIGYSSYGGNRSLELMVSPGDVYFTVDDHFSNTSFTPYTVAVSFDTSDACECNNQFSDACTVTTDETLQAKIRGTNTLEAPSVDVDYYIMNVPFCGQLVVNLTDIGGLNLEVIAYNATDTINPIANSSYGGNRSLTINVSTGVYYFRVDDHFNNTSPNFYTLAFTFAANPAIPVVTPAGPFAFCIGDSVTLTTSSIIPHFWSTGDTSKNITVYTTGIYADTVRLNNGCTAYSNPVSVEADSLLPTPTVVPPGPLTFCQGESVRLFSSSAIDNVWSTGDTVSVIDASSTGMYIDTVKANVNCFSFSTPVSITVNPNPPVPTITPQGPINLCQGGSITLTSSSSVQNSWSTGATGYNILVNSTGTYLDTVKTDLGCFSVSAPVSVTVNPNPPVPVISPASAIACPNQTDTLQSNTPVGNHWSTGDTGSITFISRAGTYTDTVINTYGCEAISNASIVTVGESATAGFSETHTQLSYTFTNTSSNGISYLWNFGDGDTSTNTNPIHTYAHSGNELVTLITTNACGSDTFSLEVNVTTGIQQVSNTELWKITPNPCEICQLTGTVDAKDLVIIDVTGRTCKAVFTKTAQGYQIELPGAASGIYFVKDLRTQEVLKFVKD